MNIRIFTVIFLIAISVLIPTVLASTERPDAYAEWDESSTFTTTGTAVARVVDYFMNADSNRIETLIADIYTERNESNPELKVILNETGTDTGIFEGTIIFSETIESVGNTLQVRDGDVVTVEYTYSQIPGSDKKEDMMGVGQEKTIQNSQKQSGIISVDKASKDKVNLPPKPINSSNGEKIRWLELSYPATGTGVVRVIDPDMSLNPDEFDNFDVDVWSDSDAGGISLTMTEIGVAAGIFEGTVSFVTTGESSGNKLRVTAGDIITAEYEDNTLPDPYTIEDELDILGTAMINPPADDTAPVEEVNEEILLSPHKQMRNGVIPSKVICDESFEKIYRPSGYAAACVKPSSVDKLTERGWSIHVLK